MAVSDAQKRAANKYIKEHMSTLACKVRKEQAAAFHAYCEARGMTSNTVIKTYVVGCIEKDETALQEAAGAPAEAGAISLPLEALEIAQEAAERTGEAPAEFLTRAAKAQAKRDKLSLHMGLNPVTGEKLQRSKEGGTDHE